MKFRLFSVLFLMSCFFYDSLAQEQICNVKAWCNGPSNPPVTFCEDGDKVYPISTFESGDIIVEFSLESGSWNCDIGQRIYYNPISLCVNDGYRDLRCAEANNGRMYTSSFTIKCIKKGQPLNLVVSGHGEFSYTWYYSKTTYADDEPNNSIEIATTISSICPNRGTINDGTSIYRDNEDYYSCISHGDSDYFLVMQPTRCVKVQWLPPMPVRATVEGQNGYLFENVSSGERIQFKVYKDAYCGSVYDCAEYSFDFNLLESDWINNSRAIKLCEGSAIDEESRLINDGYGFEKIQGGLKFNKGTTSEEILPANTSGKISYRVDKTDQHVVFGLSNSSTTNGYEEIEYGISLQQATWNRMQLNVFEGGSNKGKFATVYEGDIIIIERVMVGDEARVSYYLERNCERRRLYTSETGSSECLLLDMSIRNEGGYLSRFSKSGDWMLNNCTCD